MTSNYVGTWYPDVWVSTTGNVRSAKGEIATLVFNPDGTGKTSLKKLFRTRRENFAWYELPLPPNVRKHPGATSCAGVELMPEAILFYICVYDSINDSIIAFYSKDVPGLAGAKVIYKRAN